LRRNGLGTDSELLQAILPFGQPICTGLEGSCGFLNRVESELTGESLALRSSATEIARLKVTRYRIGKRFPNLERLPLRHVGHGNWETDQDVLPAAFRNCPSRPDPHRGAICDGRADANSRRKARRIRGALGGLVVGHVVCIAAGFEFAPAFAEAGQVDDPGALQRKLQRGGQHSEAVLHTAAEVDR
jgi:hypothetical protein